MKKAVKVFAIIAMIVAIGMTAACTKEESGNSTSPSNNGGTTNQDYSRYPEMILGKWLWTEAVAPNGMVVAIPENDRITWEFIPIDGPSEYPMGDGTTITINGLLLFPVTYNDNTTGIERIPYNITGNMVKDLWGGSLSFTIKGLTNTKLTIELNGSTIILYRINS